jgi:hypothetical protein
MYCTEQAWTRMNKYEQYSAIKRLIDECFTPKGTKKYEDFIKKLVMILRL